MHSLVIAILCVLTLPSIAKSACDVGNSFGLQQEDVQTVIVSDLHFGVGKVNGTWDNQEDFRWADEFCRFLKSTHAEGKGGTNLILNGDTFELWQSLSSHDCRYYEEYEEDGALRKYELKSHGCTERDALSRLRRVMKEHKEELDAIGNFASLDHNKVIIVPGNHDAALLFTQLREEVIQELRAPRGRIEFRENGYWLSNDKKILVEHGHQIGEDVNKWQEWPFPFILNESSNDWHLRRSWGERFVQRYYNRFENKYQIIDNLGDELTGISYGIATEGIQSIDSFFEFLKFFAFDVSWSQFKQALDVPQDGATTGAETIHAVKEFLSRMTDKEKMDFVADSLLTEIPSTDSIVKTAAKKAIEAGTFPNSLLRLTETERGIKLICERREIIASRQRELGIEPINVCRGDNLSAMTSAITNVFNDVTTDYLKSRYKKLLSEDKLAEPFLVFVYSHTHKATIAKTISVEPEWSPQIINTGAWQRVVSDEQLRFLRHKYSILEDSTVLTNLKLINFPECYSYVVIKSGDKYPQPELMYWANDAENGWINTETCLLR